MFTHVSNCCGRAPLQQATMKQKACVVMAEASKSKCPSDFRSSCSDMTRTPSQRLLLWKDHTKKRICCRFPLFFLGYGESISQHSFILSGLIPVEHTGSGQAGGEHGLINSPSQDRWTFQCTALWPQTLPASSLQTLASSPWAIWALRKFFRSERFISLLP